MSFDKKEIHYYPELWNKFRQYLEQELGPHFFIADSENKKLNLMAEEISNKLSVPNVSTYIAPLQTDIAIGLTSGVKLDNIFLLEVKRGSSLTLMHYSQLVGYLQVAKMMQVGLLVLVKESPGTSHLSGDFSKLIQLKQLTCNWYILDNISGIKKSYRTGICVYTPGNGIDWVDTGICGGISSWEDLKVELLKA